MGFADLLSVGERSVRGILGGSLSYVSGVGDSVSVNGVFDAAYERVDLGQPGVSSTGPAVFLSLADLPSDPETDLEARVVVAGRSYRAHTVEKSLGGVLLLLAEVT